MMVVICILVALLAAGFLIWSMVRTRVAVSATQTLITALSTQISSYSAHARLWTWQEPSGTKTGQLFDLNHDGLIDGSPGAIATTDLDGGFSPELIASGYRGFIAMTGTAIKKSMLAKNLQPVDAWQHPIRIGFAAKIYGTAGFGIWSAGPDGIDGTADDLISW